MRNFFILLLWILFLFLSTSPLISAIEIFGTVYEDEGTISIGANISIQIYWYDISNSQIGGSANGFTDAAGQYRIEIGDANADDILIIFIDDGIHNGSAVAISNGGNIDIDIYQNHLILRDDQGGTSGITNEDISYVDDSDPYNLSVIAGDNLSVASGITLLIWTGDTYTPGGEVDIDGDCTIAAGATLDIEGNTLRIGNTLKCEGTLDASGDGNITVAGDIECNGTIDASGDGDINVDGYVECTGFLDSSGTGDMYAGGDVNFSDGTFSPGSGIFYFDNTAQLTSNGVTFNNIQIGTDTSEGTLTLLDNLDIDGDLTVGTAPSGNTFIVEDIAITAAGDINLTNLVDFNSNGSTFIFDGTTNLTSDSQSLYNIQIGTATEGGSLRTADDMDVDGTFIIMDNGNTTFNIAGDTLFIASPDFDITNLDNFNTNNATIVFDGTTNLTSDNWVFNNIQIGTDTSEGTLTLLDNLDINGDLTVGTAPSGNTFIVEDIAITAAGDINLTNLVDFNSNGSTFIFDGTTNLTSDSQSFNYVQIGTATEGGSLRTADDMDVDGTFIIMDNGNTTFNIAGDTLFIASPDFDITNLDNFNTDNATIVFDGTTDLTTADNPLYNIQIGTDTSGGNLTLLDSLDVNGDITVGTAGTTVFTVSNRTINAAGDINLTNLVDFNSNGSTFIFDGGTEQDFNPAGYTFNNIEIQDDNTDVALQNNLTCSDLTIQADTTFDIASLTLIVNNNYNNLGFLRRTIDATFTLIDINSGTVVYYGSIGSGGTIYADYNSGPSQLDYYNLQIEGPATFTITAPLTIARDFIVSGGVFNANNQVITITRNFNHSGGTFNHGNGTVIFTDNSVTSEILGSSTFYNFQCTEGGKTIQFEESETQVIDNLGSLTITGSGSDPGSVIRLLSTAADHPGDILGSIFDDITSVPEHWHLDIAPSATASINYVYVELSWAENPIIPDNASFRPPPALSWCHNWRIHYPVDNSGAIDSDHNGKIDRIRVQVAPGLNLNDDFSALITPVSGYRVTGFTTYDITDPVDQNPDHENDDTFYIILEEGPDLDTDAKPVWWIKSNNSLKVTTGIEKYIFTKPIGVQFSQIPSDKAWPVIGYTLAVADMNELFVCFSEPVTQNTGFLIEASDFQFNGNPAANRFPVTTQGNGIKEIIVRFPANITASQILNQADVTFTATIRDMAPGLHQLGDIDTTHRVSDIGLGTVYNGIIEPIWAADETEQQTGSTGVGYIRLFDGSSWLQDQNITLQAHIHNSITADPDTRLYFDVNIEPAYLRNGMWLPPFTTTDYNGIVPAENPAPPRSIEDIPVNSQLRNFTFDPGDPEIKHNARIEFLFEIPGSSLYCARVSAYTETWYRNIRPWSFKIYDIIHQDSDVTILNNVINPIKGETVKLHYILKKSGTVTIHIFDLKGDIVQKLYCGRKTRGSHSIAWDGRNRGGRIVARGIYFLKITTPEVDKIKKILVVK